MIKDYTDEYFESFKASLPDSDLATQDFNNSFNEGKDMRNLHLGQELDTVQETVNWFKKAKPEPTSRDIQTQTAVCLEEVCELLEALNLNNTSAYEFLSEMSDDMKQDFKYYSGQFENITYQQRIDITDACCDINVTSTGILTLLGGIDVLGATKEVIRSNNSKMVDGEFIFDDNGKIAKPESFSQPDLTKFVGDTNGNK